MAPLNQEAGEDFNDMLGSPALDPPNGVSPNFEDRPNRNNVAYAALVVCVTLSSMFALLRVYARVIYLKKVHIADLVGLLALGTYFAFVWNLFDMLHTDGFFVHQWNFRVGDLITFNRGFFLAYMLYCATVMTVKTAIIVEWLYIFVPSHTHNYFFWACHVLLWLNILFYLAMMILPNAACTPHDKIWNPLLPGKCTNTSFSSTSVAAVNFATDIILIILPQRVIWGLQMSLQKRIGVSLIFLIGVLGCVSAGFKLAASVPYNTSRDTTYTFAALTLWSLAELTCGILVFCMPSIPKALKNVKLDGIAVSLKSWAGSSMERLRKSRAGSISQVSWPQSSRRPSKSSLRQQIKIQQKMEQASHPLPRNTSESGGNGLDPMVKQDSGEQAAHDDSTIVRVTQFTTDESYGPDISDEQYKRQHPWAEKQ
ncbi:hypothetical protein Hte_003743 [Hypoxylon texense]